MIYRSYVPGSNVGYIAALQVQIGSLHFRSAPAKLHFFELHSEFLLSAVTVT